MSYEPKEGQTNLFAKPGKHAEWCSEGCTVDHKQLSGTMMVNGETHYANVYLDLTKQPDGSTTTKAKLYIKKAGAGFVQKDWAPKGVRETYQQPEGQEKIPY